MSGQSRWWMADLPWSNTFCTFCTFCTHLAAHLAHLVRFCTSGTSAHFACLQTMGQLRNTLLHCSNAFGLVTPCEILHQKTAQYLLPFGVCQRMPGSCQKAEKGNCGMLRKYCWLVSFKGVLIRLIFNLPDFPQIDQLLSLPMSRQHH